MVWEGNLPHNTNNPPMEAPVHPARQGWNRTSAYQGIPTSVELVDNSFKEQVNRFVNEFKLMSMSAATLSNHNQRQRKKSLMLRTLNSSLKNSSSIRSY